jgi:16S rRNA processing protein RimM
VVLEAAPLEDPDALWVHELIGSDVYDGAGTVLGRVTAVEANPASDLLVLDRGGLIPLRFVVDHGPSRVVVDIPLGLLE